MPYKMADWKLIKMLGYERVIIAGSDMYMAFGVKEAPQSPSPAQGGVVVWPTPHTFVVRKIKERNKRNFHG